GDKKKPSKHKILNITYEYLTDKQTLYQGLIKPRSQKSESNKPIKQKIIKASVSVKLFYET
ncbi:TPA: hypothetical protein ACODJZ_004422, partial [Salmonella enterica subsp. enterica serovar Infantis]